MNFSIILLSIFSISTVNAQNPCNDLFDVYIYDVCYRVFTTPENYTQAQQTCYDMNRPLAILHNGMQGSYLATLVNAETGVNNGAFWIGLQRETNTSKFYWADGSSMHWTFWNIGYPGTKYNQVAVSTLNGRWMTLDESDKHVFACSFDPKSVTTTTTSRPTEPASTTL